jgi:hypothetical protein
LTLAAALALAGQSISSPVAAGQGNLLEMSFLNNTHIEIARAFNLPWGR